MERQVAVWDKPQVVDVYRKSRSVWIAVGDYMAERLEVKGLTESTAINRQREAARYRRN